MSKLLDTWAWIEFYEGSEVGEEVYSILQSDETVYTPVVSVAELSDNFNRNNFETDYSWREIRGFVETQTRIADVSSAIASEAGKIKAEERKNKRDFGLMDAIILATAREKDLDLVTGDPHLTEKPVADKMN